MNPGSFSMRSVGQYLLAAACCLATIALAAWLGFAFYAPTVGETAGGRESGGETVPMERPRDRATVEVTAVLAETGQERPTLAQVIEFFALEEDTWRCTVIENYGEAAGERAEQYVQRRLRLGDEVVLCLD